MEALHDLVKSGKVHYIGASSMWAVQFAQMQFAAERNGWTKFISMQNHYNLLYREEEREMIRFCNDTGVGLIPVRCPLETFPRPQSNSHVKVGTSVQRPSAFGSTTRSEGEEKADQLKTGRQNNDRQIIERVEELAKKHDWKMSHVALAWINKRVSSPIIGFSSVARMEEALDARGKELTEEEEKYLEELYVPVSIVGHS
jgi:aryl-alcohol dehydrogenase-like predicted oxidoreductase